MKFTPVPSDRLFFDRWQYCIKIYLNEVSALRGLPSNDIIDKILLERDHWRKQVRMRWPGTTIIHADRSISSTDCNNLKAFAEFLRPHTDKFKITISVSQAWIYCNDLEFIKNVVDLPYIVTHALSEAHVTRPRDVVVLKNSPHTHRSYFRNCKLDPDQKQRLEDFLQNQTDVRMSPALQRWFEQPWARLQDYFFVDYVGEHWNLMLSLVCPQIIRKTLPIITK